MDEAYLRKGKEEMKLGRNLVQDGDDNSFMLGSLSCGKNLVTLKNY